MFSRFSKNHELSEDNLRRIAPSIFADTAHESRSDRYAYIPTIEVLRGLHAEGFRVFDAKQSRSRIPGKAEYTKHMVRLRHASQFGQVANVGDSTSEVILINSHDGTSAFNLMAGLFRFVCSNGLIVPDTQCQAIKVNHSGNVREKVTEGAFEVLDGLTRVIEARESMRQITLEEPERLALANAALTVRYGLEEGQQAPITARQLLQPRRWEDDKSDLWTTFNRIQENATKGGQQGRSANGQRRATRAITSIDKDVKINRALWQLAESMKALKTGS